MNQIMILKVLNYVVQGYIYYWFYNRVLSSDQPYLRGAVRMVAMSLLIMVTDMGLTLVPALSAAWVRPALNSVLMVLFIMWNFRVSLRRAFLNAYLPFMVLVSTGEVIMFSLAGAVLGMPVQQVWEVSVPETAILYLFSDGMDLLVLAAGVRMLGSSDLSLMPTPLLAVLLASVFFQTSGMAVLSYLSIHGGVGAGAYAFVIAAYVLCNAGTLLLLREIHRNQQNHARIMALNEAESAVDSQMPVLQEENRRALELQQEISAAIVCLDQDCEENQALAERYRSFREAGYTDDAVLDTLLKSYAARFDQMGIRYDFEIACSMQGSLDPADTVKVFSNLLDNAMEAVQGNPADLRSVRLQVKKAANCYSICAVNDLPRKQTAMAKKVHGEGLRILREFAEMHSGTLELTQDRGIYTAEMTYQTEGAAG